MKQFVFGKESRQELFKGIQKMYDAVSCTLGVHGRTVLIERGHGMIELTKDGVTVADEVFSPNKNENLGMQLIREAAQKANTEAGDSTTSAIVLAYNLIKEGLKEVEQRVNVYQLAKGIEKACKVAVEKLGTFAKKIETEEDFAKVATISTQDEDIGRVIAKAFIEAGEYGCIDIERSDIPGIQPEKTEGISFDKGWDAKGAFQHYLTDIQKKQCVQEDIPVLVVEDKIENENQLIPLLEKLADNKMRPDLRYGWQPGVRKILVIADEFTGTGLGLMISNNLMMRQSRGQTGFHIIYAVAPSFGRHKVEILKDIAAVTGGTFISRENGGKRVEQCDLSDLGRAKKIVIQDKKTIIVSEQKGDWGDGVREKIQERQNLLKAEIADMPNDHIDKKELERRLATLTNGVTVLKVGSESENERNEMRRRVEDGVRAVKSAREEGVTPGCGVGLLKCVKDVDNLIERTTQKDQKTGMEIFKRALHSVSLRLLEVAYIEDFSKTSGLDPEAYRTNLVEEMKKKEMGYDFQNDCLADMMQLGVYDAKKAIRVALESAASVARAALKIDCAIGLIDEDKQAFDYIREKIRG